MKVGVLMASYNGELFLRQQIESILNQSNSNNLYKFVISDDGSSDQTLSIISEYPMIDLVHNDSTFKGPSGNFINGLRYVQDCDFVFFSDQDDIWFSNKLSLFFSEINNLNNEIPGLIFSGLELVDSYGNSLNVSFHKNERIPIGWSSKLGNIYLQNCAPGCSMMINSHMAKKLIETFSADVVMHDWWAMLHAAVYSNIIGLDYSTAYYRQHSFNAVGASKKFRFVNLFYYLNRSFENFERSLRQLNSFSKSLSRAELKLVSPLDRRRLNDLCNLFNKGGIVVKCRLFFSPNKFKSTIGKDLLTRFFILIFKAGA